MKNIKIKSIETNKNSITRLALKPVSILIAVTYLLFSGTGAPLCYAGAKIPLIVQERAGITRTNEPVTLGVPLKKGTLMPGTPVRIVDANSNPLNAQFKTMALWNDGSIQWLKCDFQASCGPNNTSEYALELNTTHQTSTQMNVTESQGSITVTTGPLRFSVNKTSFNLIDQAWLDVNGDHQFGSDEIIITPGSTSTGSCAIKNGTQFMAANHAPENIEIEEQGPLKTVIKISGRHYNSTGSDVLLKYETRIYAYAGKTYIKVRHVYANGKSQPTLNDPGNLEMGETFDRYSLDIQLNLSGNKTINFGGDNGSPYSLQLSPGQTGTLIQKDRTSVTVPLSYEITHGNTTMNTGSRAEGWGDFSDSRWGMTIIDRYFWQKYPKGITFHDTGKTSMELAPSPEFLWIAMGTTDEIIFNFHTTTQTTEIKDLAMGTSKAPLIARTTPQQYADSQAFYTLIPLTTTDTINYPTFKTYIDTVSLNHLSNIETSQLYGNINFGDVPRYPSELADFRDESGWGNNYYDGILSVARLFAATGDAKHFDILVPFAWHFMETDCWNTYDPEDWMNGFCPGYSTYHRTYANYNAHWPEGIWYYYYLTGDERAKEIGLRGANSIVEHQPWGAENVNCRTAYQHASNCIEAWKTTRTPKYLEHARKLLIDKILATQDKYGLIGWWEGDTNTVHGEQSWMMALYSDTLWKYLKENPDPNIITKLTKLADFMDRYARKKNGEEEYWNEFLPPDNHHPPIVNDHPEPTLWWTLKNMVAGTYAYTYELTGNPRFKTLASNLLNNIWNGQQSGLEFWGKESGLVMKNGLHAVSIVAGPTLNGLSLISPNGGEQWIPGTVHPLQWNTTGTITTVKIEYSTDNGTHWQIITNSTSNTGSYSWTVPNITTNSCWIRVSSTANPSILDINDAYFSIASTGTPVIHLSKTQLFFGSLAGYTNTTTPAQTVAIENYGNGTLQWTATSNNPWISITPTSGSGDSTISVNVNPQSLTPGTYTGTVTLNDPSAGNTPLTLSVTLTVLNQGAPPYGSFETPADQTTVTGSIPVTGWVLDDIETTTVKIMRDPMNEEGTDLIYIGDAVFVEGARPDVETAFPHIPLNSRAGFGYMLLTYGLPNQGMYGTYRLHAIAYDKEGHAANLGSKTIICDNQHAAKPFGAIDTPTQGGTASGSSFVNFGWALTPPPGMIPIDGSTLDVYIDGVYKGHVSYSDPRPGFDELFPGYLNNAAPGGHFYIDTHQYSNGLHTISWHAFDDRGNQDGIGSRYFTVSNLNQKLEKPRNGIDFLTRTGSMDILPIDALKGYQNNDQSGYTTVNTDPDGIVRLSIAPLQRIVIRLNSPIDPTSESHRQNEWTAGAMKVGNEFRPLPPGSTFDIKNGIYYWQPGPGFFGEYSFVFIRKNNEHDKQDEQDQKNYDSRTINESNPNRYRYVNITIRDK